MACRSRQTSELEAAVLWPAIAERKPSITYIACRLLRPVCWDDAVIKVLSLMRWACRAAWWWTGLPAVCQQSYIDRIEPQPCAADAHAQQSSAWPGCGWSYASGPRALIAEIDKVNPATASC
jgi:hypothetical protein